MGFGLLCGGEHVLLSLWLTTQDPSSFSSPLTHHSSATTALPLLSGAPPFPQQLRGLWRGLGLEGAQAQLQAEAGEGEGWELACTHSFLLSVPAAACRWGWQPCAGRELRQPVSPQPAHCPCAFSC